MKKCTVLLVLAGFCLNGCCTLFRPDSQIITINSEPKGAKIQVGEYRGTTPYQVSIPKGKDYVVKASYKGEHQTVSLSRKIDELYLVNILVWPGLIVDYATGDMYKYDPVTYDFDFTE